MERQRNFTLDVKQLSDTAFSVKLDGKEISDYLTEISFTARAGEAPIFSMKLLSDTVSLHTIAGAQIPAPYDWMVKEAIEDGIKKRCPN